MGNRLKLKIARRGLLVRLGFVSLLLTIGLITQSYSADYIDGDDLIPPAPSIWSYFTILGVDSDDDNVRDDVELWINENYEDPNVRRALKSMARTYSDKLRYYDQPEKYLRAADLTKTRWKCIEFVYANISFSIAHSNWRKLENEILNNPWRRYIAKKGAGNIPSGSYSIPDTGVHKYILGCDFKVIDPNKIMDGFLKKHPRYQFSEEDRKEFKEIHENTHNDNSNGIFRPSRRSL